MEQVKLSKEEFFYLISKNKISLENIVNKNIEVCFAEDYLIDLHEWVQDELQVSGFDESYGLTSEGEILDALVDSLNI